MCEIPGPVADVLPALPLPGQLALPPLVLTAGLLGAGTLVQGEPGVGLVRVIGSEERRRNMYRRLIIDSLSPDGLSSNGLSPNGLSIYGRS